jgi:carbonic anhydrase
VASGLARGDLKLHGWVYKIQTGQVFAYDPEHAQFVPVEQVLPAPVPAAVLNGDPRAVAI